MVRGGPRRRDPPCRRFRRTFDAYSRFVYRRSDGRKKLRNVVPFPGVSTEALLRPGPADAVMSALDRAEMALRSSEMQLHLVTENVPAMIVYFDRNFVCGFSNSQYAKFLVSAKRAYSASTCPR